MNVIMYPHRSDFMDIVGEYIDFSENKELWEGVKEGVKRMSGLGQSVLEEGIEQGIEQGEELLASLMSRLLKDGRIADAELAANDVLARKEFYKEYELIGTKQHEAGR